MEYWYEKRFCPNCGYEDESMFTIEYYPYIYDCDECKYQVIIRNRREEIKELIGCHANKIKLTMWD